MAAYKGNRAPRSGKHVAVAPGGPRDMSRRVASHAKGNDARPTNPTTPATTPAGKAGPRQMSRDNGEILSSPVTGSALSAGNTWHPRVPGEYAGY